MMEISVSSDLWASFILFIVRQETIIDEFEYISDNLG